MNLWKKYKRKIKEQKMIVLKIRIQKIKNKWFFTKEKHTKAIIQKLKFFTNEDKYKKSNYEK